MHVNLTFRFVSGRQLTINYSREKKLGVAATKVTDPEKKVKQNGKDRFRMKHPN